MFIFHGHICLKFLSPCFFNPNFLRKPDFHHVLVEASASTRTVARLLLQTAGKFSWIKVQGFRPISVGWMGKALEIWWFGTWLDYDFPIILGDLHHPNWLDSIIFQRGRYTNHQPVNHVKPVIFQWCSIFYHYFSKGLVETTNQKIFPQKPAFRTAGWVAFRPGSKFRDDPGARFHRSDAQISQPPKILIPSSNMAIWKS